MTIVEATPDAAAITAANASPEQLFGYAKSIGIGGIAMAGIIGVIKSWGVIKSAFTLVGKIFKGNSEAEDAPRTQRDLSMKIMLSVRCSLSSLPPYSSTSTLWGQLTLHDRRYTHCRYHRLPLHHRCRQRHCHCRV